jgi:hypothetical protein
LALRIAEQQQVIANLVTVDSEQRLGKTLLQLARTLGKRDQRRTRISFFMQRFRHLGSMATDLDRFLVIDEKKLTDYLARIAIAAGHHRGSQDESRQLIRQKLFPKLAQRRIGSIGR